MKKFIFLLFLVGCGYSHSEDLTPITYEPLYISLWHDGIPLFVSSDASDPTIVVTATKWWNDQTGLELFNSGTSNKVYIVKDSSKVAEDKEGISEFISENGNLICKIFVTSYRIGLIKHELGHCLGFQHSSNSDNIMLPEAH